jgi:hypothetical protein
MSTDPNFTDDETLLAADRFLIAKLPDGFRMQLATDFMATGKHLSNIRDCERLVGESLERGHKVTIKVPHGSFRVSQTPSP